MHCLDPLEPRRLLSAGDLDSTFGGDGVVTTDLGSGNYAAATVVQPDGKILVAGSAGGDAIVLRYTTSGALDSTFGNGGVARVSRGGGEYFSDLVLLPDGRIVAGGSASASTAARPF